MTNLFTAKMKNTYMPRYKTAHPRRPHLYDPHAHSSPAYSKRRITALIVAFASVLAMLSSLIATHSFTNNILETYYTNDIIPRVFPMEAKGRVLQNRASSPLRSNSIQKQLAALGKQQQENHPLRQTFQKPIRRTVVSHPEPISSVKREIAWLMSFPNRYVR